MSCVYHGWHMRNPYSPPKSHLDDLPLAGENNSGAGRGSIPPAGVRGWSRGAFFLSWIWAIFNKTWRGLLALIPYVGFLVVYLGVRGRELVWRNMRWESLEHFNQKGVTFGGGAPNGFPWSRRWVETKG